MNKIILTFLIISIFSCSNKGLQYSDDFIILDIKYLNRNIANDLGLRNITIDFNKKSFCPSLVSEGPQDHMSEYFFTQKNGIDYIEIIGSPFFSDIYEVSCLDESCCYIKLKTKNKELILLRNSLSFQNEGCPYPKF